MPICQPGPTPYTPRWQGHSTRSNDRRPGRALEIHHVRIMEVVQIASLDRDDRFVVREPFRHAVPEQLEADLGIVDVTCDDFPALPATLLLQRERHVEVVQVDEGSMPDWISSSITRL